MMMVKERRMSGEKSLAIFIAGSESEEEQEKEKEMGRSASGKLVLAFGF